MSKMFRIGLFGGSFDPITKGHLYVAEQLIEQDILDYVEFVPAYVSYHGKSYNAHPLDRAEMILEAIQDSKYPAQMGVNRFEIQKKMDTCTFDFVDKYLELMDDPAVADRKWGLPPKQIQHYFIVGGDNARIIPKFKHGDELMERIPFVVVNRGDIEVDGLEWCSEEPHIVTSIGNKFGDCSSTNIRKAILEIDDRGLPAEFLRDWCPWNVFRYIMDAEMYTEESFRNRNWE